MHTPLKFPNSPEGKRLFQAREEWHRVLKQIEQFTKEQRAKVKGSAVHLLYKDENYVKASKECEAATSAYYIATGDISQLTFPPAPRGGWPAFQESIEKNFGKIAQDLNSNLEKILPWFYGFATAYAIVTLSVDDVERGYVVFCVTLRTRKSGEKVDFLEEPGVGLVNIVEFQNPNGWDLNPEDLSHGSVKKHAEKLLEYGRSFLTDPSADWAGLQEWVRQKNEKWLAENPWLKKFS